MSNIHANGRGVSRRILIAGAGLVASLIFLGSVSAEESPDALSAAAAVDYDLNVFNSFVRRAEMRAVSGEAFKIDDVVIPGLGIDPNFPTDPVDPIDPTDPNSGGLDPFDPLNPGGFGDAYFPGFQRKFGSAEILAMEVLFQTLNFYGVKFAIQKTNTRIDFKVLESKTGYFKNLTKLDIAYAIREFSRYFAAMMCNEVTPQNFYRALAQVPEEEIALRFKYDMAWALMSNSLPREPNQIQKLGRRWTSFQQLVNSTSSLKTDSEESKELTGWMRTMSDIVKALTQINKMTCFVDIRPIPKDELKKRVVIKKLLEMDKRANQRYEQFKDLLDAAKLEGAKEQLSSLGAPTTTGTAAQTPTTKPAQAPATKPVQN